MGLAPKKLYYRIGEVCQIVGVESHVLRYWETEFPRLQPPKNKAGQRIYRPKDVELLLEIRRLLYDDGYTIAGARKHLATSSPSPRVEDNGLSTPPRAPAQESGSAAPSSPPATPREDPLSRVRRELEDILTLLNRG